MSTILEKLREPYISLQLVGVLCGALFTGGNVGAIIFGPQAVNRRNKYPALIQLQNWDAFYEMAKDTFTKTIPVGAISTLSAYALARRHISAEHSYLLLYSAISTLSIVPWTLLVILPVNQKLKDLKSSKNSELVEVQGPKLLERWDVLSGIRTVIGGSGFLAGLLALVLS